MSECLRRGFASSQHSWSNMRATNRHARKRRHARATTENWLTMRSAPPLLNRHQAGTPAHSTPGLHQIREGAAGCRVQLADREHAARVLAEREAVLHAVALVGLLLPAPRLHLLRVADFRAHHALADLAARVLDLRVVGGLRVLLPVVAATAAAAAAAAALAAAAPAAALAALAFAAPAHPPGCCGRRCDGGEVGGSEALTGSEGATPARAEALKPSGVLARDTMRSSLSQCHCLNDHRHACVAMQC